MIYLKSNFFKLSIIFIITFSIFYLLNYNNFYSNCSPFSDLAADMLLSNKIYTEGYLLTGHYSRFTFHHPGPFFIYINVFFEQLLKYFSFSKVDSWLFSSLFLNTLFITIAVKLFHNLLNKTLSFFYSIIILSCIIMIYSNTVAPSLYPYLWMPGKIVLPYLVFILTLPFIYKGDFRYLLLSFIFLGICIHAYVVMPIMTLPILIIVFILALRQKKFSLEKKDKRFIIISLLIGVFFALPLILDLLINIDNIYKSNLVKILDFAFFNKHINPSWSETFIFFFSFFKIYSSPFIITLFILGLISLFFNENKIKKNFFIVLFLAIGISIIFILYYHKAPAPLYEFIGRYYHAVILFVYIYTILTIFTARHPFLYKIIVFLFFGLCFIKTIYFPNDFVKNIKINTLTKTIKQLTSSDFNAKIEYTEHMFWKDVAGILYQGIKDKYPICTTKTDMEFLFTDKMICKDKNANIKLVKTENCNGKCAFIFDDIGIIDLKNNKSETYIKRYNFKELNLSKGWSSLEKSHVWSVGKESEILLKIKNKKSLTGILYLKAHGLGKQKITLVINDKIIGTKNLSVPDILVFNFDKKLIIDEKYNRIKFIYSNPHTPQNGDKRVLAMALKAIMIE